MRFVLLSLKIRVGVAELVAVNIGALLYRRSLC